MTNAIDKLVAYFAPGAAVRRQNARSVLAYYEAAKPNKLQKQRKETGGSNDAVGAGGTSLRQQARHFDQNYDLAKGVLNTMVNNVVGPTGIQPEPQPRNKDGSINEDFSKAITKLWRDWEQFPEVTGLHDWPSAQRIMARTWFRDGEVFAQTLEGAVAYLDHGTKVPLSLELIEPDYVPIEYTSNTPAVIQGIGVNAWGRPLTYYVYRQSPMDVLGNASAFSNLKQIPADRMLHLASRDRIRQLRGVSVFASVMTRFDDLKDYEESERIAAKVAASMAAFIKKGSPDQYEQADTNRMLKFRPGMIFDDLRPGEEIGTIDTNRPNPNLETYRSGQLKAVAAGAGPTYSSVSRTYDGTYSAQRQELVEGWTAYATLSNEFIGRVIRPVYKKFIAVAILSGKLKVPAGLDMESLDDALFIAPQMPWIDPKKEAEAWSILEDKAYISGPEIIRKRGGNPSDVLEQEKKWRAQKEAAGIKDVQVQIAETYTDAAAGGSSKGTKGTKEPDDDNEDSDN